jgi:hypothetical protein
MLGTRSLTSIVHSDPLLFHPLRRTVASQNAEVWAMEMLRTTAENKAEFDPTNSAEIEICNPIM